MFAIFDKTKPHHPVGWRWGMWFREKRPLALTGLPKELQNPQLEVVRKF
jgi:hypothetical protein